MTVIDPRNEIISSISIDKSRVKLSPHITFLCGGEVDAKKTTNHSVRNMFLNEPSAHSNENIQFVLAEDYKDWKDGYTCLSDFENDIAHISSKVIIIPETAGSLTELGLFFGNPVIREKLTVILNTPHHEEASFIKFGILNSLEEQQQDTVLPYNIDYYNVENIVKSEIVEALNDVIEACKNLDKTSNLSLEKRGHILFIIFQIIDLFHALTVTEITQYISLLGIIYNKRIMHSSLYILQKFDLVKRRKRGDTYFYFSHLGATDRVDIKHKDTSTNFDYLGKKIEVKDFYNSMAKTNGNFRKRVAIINSISEDQ